VLADVHRVNILHRDIKPGNVMIADTGIVRLRLRHLLGAALFYAGEYSRAASVFDAVGHDYRRYFPPGDPDVLDCAYHAGYAYAETGKPGKALP
jgi:hypothetical protein